MIWHKLQFDIQWMKGEARAGTITLNDISLTTPVFMPVGTKATIKWLFLEMLRNPEYLGELEPIMMMLSNTFHLFLRPGHKLVQEAGGVQQFMRWPGLVLTDSWGFQVFSLGLGKTDGMNKKWPIVSIREEWIKFQSPIDWSRHTMTPEECVDIQCALGSDIMMMLDVCSPWWSDPKVYARQMAMTHRRAQRQYEHFESVYDRVRWVLFPIVQWGTDMQLRQESIDFLSPYARDGIAVGWVSVGESRELIQQVTSFCGSRLPSHVPRYLMGIGDPETIRYAIYAGFDMFDCVMPTRLGRHGTAYSHDGNLHLTNTKFRNDHSPLWIDTKNGLSKKYTKAYIHHLLREKEMLGGLILSLHNIFYLHEMVANIREEIIRG